jgi:hypothetical protein
VAERAIVTSQLEPNKTGQHSLGNTNELTNTTAANEEVHLGAARPSENRVGTGAGTHTHRRKRIVDGFNDEGIAHPDDARRSECYNTCPPTNP